jgi:hypothetical protein
MGRKAITTEEFIKRSKLKHGDKYDYSKTEYVEIKTPTTIICPIHGEFEMEPRNHLRSDSGCDKCKSNVRLTNEDFINKAREIYGDKYDYSKVNYLNKNSKVIIICPIHGEFEKIAKYHTMNGSGCNLCGNIKIGNFSRDTLDGFINKAIKIHGDKYDYSLVNYNTQKDKVKIICPIHGDFEQRPSVHLNGSGCPKCKESKGEKTVREYLENNNLNYRPQHIFDGCKDKYPLKFDFYLPEQNICIEYNGAQHYRPVKYWGGEETLKKIKRRDKIKKEYCLSNNIKLLTIRYNEDTIEKLKKGLL